MDFEGDVEVEVPPGTSLVAAAEAAAEAEAAGVGTIGGIEMLAWQGALAFEKWTEQPAPLDLMRKEAIRVLEVHED